MANKKSRKSLTRAQRFNNDEFLDMGNVAPITKEVSLKAKNPKQQEYMNRLENFSIIVGTGVAGSGKTYIAARKAAKWLIDPSNPIEKIIVARPAEGKGKTLGLMPGDKNEKMAGWVVPVVEALEVELGKTGVQTRIHQQIIELLPLEQVKGRTFNNTAVIIDEAEDIDVEVIKTLLSRPGQDCKMMINGDVLQKDIKKYSGLEYVLDLIKFSEGRLPIVVTDFDKYEHCVRSKEARANIEFMDALDRSRKGEK